MAKKNSEAITINGQTFIPVDEIAKQLHVQKRCAAKKMRAAKLLITVSGTRGQYVREESFERWLVGLEGKC